ncbi:hypothetical protein [Cellulomonas marina]|uniref:hypothetical protein n=1 Tax=Cellulomonas marina TaxID=988821 RepID=UPI000B7E2C8B|nr:hypothetical protein [Cellulomonas marina]
MGQAVPPDPERADDVDLPVRRRMLDAATRMVVEAGGLAVVPGLPPLDHVVRAAGVARTTAYRAWPTKEAFALDLLCELAGPAWQGAASFFDDVGAATRARLASAAPVRRDVDGRRALLHAVLRDATRRTYEDLTAAAQWDTFVALTATGTGLRDAAARARVQTALEAAEDAFIGRTAQFYELLLGTAGFRLRAHVPSCRTLATAGAAVVEGFALRRSVSAELDVVTTLPGPDGDEEWHVVALAVVALVERFTEPDPDWEPRDGA